MSQESEKPALESGPPLRYDLGPNPKTAITSITAGGYDQKSGYATRRSKGSGDWLLIYTQGGCGDIRTHNHRLKVRAGDCLLYSPESYQDYRTDLEADSWQLLWAHFAHRPDWRRLLEWEELEQGLHLLHFPPGELRELIEQEWYRLLRRYRGTWNQSKALSMNSLERILLYAAERQSLKAETLDERIRQLCDHICEDVSADLSLDTLASRVGLSTSRLSHLFREQLGLPISHYIEQQRIEQARDLLTFTTDPIQDIAERLGYESPFYFSNRFRKATGLSPRAFRQKKVN